VAGPTTAKQLIPTVGYTGIAAPDVSWAENHVAMRAQTSRMLKRVQHARRLHQSGKTVRLLSRGRSRREIAVDVGEPGRMVPGDRRVVAPPAIALADLIARAGEPDLAGDG
jgi:hypothetical protein